MPGALGTARCGYGSRSPRPRKQQPYRGASLAAHHAQIRGRRGTQKAIGATRHDILIAYYHIVRDKIPYQDLGPSRTTDADPPNNRPGDSSASLNDSD